MAKQHYVNNVLFYESLKQYKLDIKTSEEKGLPEPPIPEYVGECILKIAEHLSYKPNFLSYPFREDMIGDAIENSLIYIKNFDPDNFKNPFAYFTQIMWYAFLRRIFKEKKQLYLKYKSIQNSNEFSEYVSQAGDDKAYTNTYISYLRDNMSEIITEFEAKKLQKRKKKNPNSLARFFEADTKEKEQPVEMVEEIDISVIEDEDDELPYVPPID